MAAYPFEPTPDALAAREGSGNFGYSAATGKYVDLVTEGVIDPAKVVPSALENADARCGPDAHHREPRYRVDAKDEAAERFHLAYGFVKILAEQRPRRLFLALGTVRDALED